MMVKILCRLTKNKDNVQIVQFICKKHKEIDFKKVPFKMHILHKPSKIKASRDLRE